MANAATGDAITTVETVYNVGAGDIICSTFVVRCTAGVVALVNIPQLHGTDEVAVPVGEKEYFRNGHRGITTVNIRGTGDASTTVDYYVAAATHR